MVVSRLGSERLSASPRNVQTEELDMNEAAITPMPLAGVRVLDLATFLAGPFCSTILAEFGAEVIKVEQPGTGDPLRKFGTMTESGDSLVWLQESRNKRCVTLDLKSPRGKAMLEEMVQKIRRGGREFSHRNAGEMGSWLEPLTHAQP